MVDGAALVLGEGLEELPTTRGGAAAVPDGEAPPCRSMEREGARSRGGQPRLDVAKGIGVPFRFVVNLTQSTPESGAGVYLAAPARERKSISIACSMSAAMATGARGAVARGAGLAGQQSMIHLELGEARIFVRPGAIDLVSEAGYGGSASALPVSRPAQRSLTLRPACSLNRPQAILLHRSASVQFVTSLHRSDCFRLERQLPGGIRTRWDTAPFHGAR